MKADATFTSIIFIILMIALASGFTLMNTRAAHAEEKISFEKAELIKAENTFYIIDKSLGETWFLSAVQAIFKSGNLGEEYWYRDGQSLVKNDDDIAKSLAESMNDYLKIQKSIKVNGVDVKISDIKAKFSVKDDEIVSEVTQKLDMSFGNTEISAKTTNVNKIKTKFKKLVSAANELVKSAMAFSGNADSYFDNEAKRIANQFGVKYKLEKNIAGSRYDIKATFLDSYEYYRDSGDKFEKVPVFLAIKLKG
ncbi:MAG: hypothetical protein V1900_00075 [Candidatus Aenigmatarchaeota archaeon]